MTRPLSPQARRNIQVETRLLAEWIALRHPNDDVRQHVYLGPIQPGLGELEYDPIDFRMLGVRRRWADALILYPDRTSIVEAKIVPDVVAIAQLTLYRRLFPRTDEYRDRMALPITLVLLTAIIDPILSEMVRAADIREEVFHPAWVDGYLATRKPRKRIISKIGI